MLSALDRAPTLTWSIFLGLVLGAVPLLIKDLSRNALSAWLCLVLAMVLAASVGALGLSLPTSSVGVFFGGMIALSAMILPGISGSFLLLVLGLYTTVFGGVHDRDLSVLIPFGLGGIVGLMVMSRVLKALFERAPKHITAAMAGLMLGSAVQLWPFKVGETYAPTVWVLAGICFCLGGGLVWLVSRFSQDS